MGKTLNPITPGEFLSAEYMQPLKISQNRLARDLSVPPTRINAIVNNKTRITPDMALRLAKYFNTSPEYWMNLQQHHDLKVAAKEFGKEIEKRVLRYEAEHTATL